MPEQMLETNSQIIITGGQGDLAQAISKEFQSVLAPSRKELDVSSIDSVQAYFSKNQADLLICTAGTSSNQLLLRLSGNEWDRVLETNLGGSWRCARAALPHMQRNACGHIIFIGSYLGFHPKAGESAYTASKAALQGLSASLAKEAGESNIRVNMVLPGFLETKMTAHLSKKQKLAIKSTHILDRFNTCEAVARFIHTLHYSLPHTSGQIFNLDSRIL